MPSRVNVEPAGIAPLTGFVSTVSTGMLWIAITLSYLAILAFLTLGFLMGIWWLVDKLLRLV